MNPALGIDLGTTYSLAAYAPSSGRVELVPNPEDSQFQVLFPSVVSLREDGSLAVGWEARRLRTERPGQSISSTKRLMKKSPALKLGDRLWTPAEISAVILNEIKSTAEKFLGQRLPRAVISVPAYFQKNEREATTDAGRQAGFDAVGVVDEPTAALLAYTFTAEEGNAARRGKVAVYDLGGGTFDISIFDVSRENFKVLATRGDTSLGGDDINERIAQKILTEITESYGSEVQQDARLVQGVRDETERAKRAVSHRGSCDIRIEDKEKGLKYVRALSRFELIDLSRDIVERTIPLCEEAIQEAGVSAEAVGEVILAGGATRMPFVQETVEKIFGRKPHSEINPDHVVALGAAVRAFQLAGKRP